MSYYKYAERDESVQVNWAEIGKNLTDTFKEQVRVREEKKAAIDAATREYDITLNTAPQGEFQDGNKFTNDYVATAQQQRLMDDKLLKSGQMDLKTYTTRRQNYVDGTTQLFDLQTKFQEVYAERMKGIVDGTLTAQNSYELSQVQGFGDFSKSQALINPVDGRVNIGMTQMINGVKTVVPNSNIPVNVLMGKIQGALPTFDVDGTTKSLVDSQGDRVFTLFKAGTLAGAGSITELTGVDAISKFGKGEWNEAAKAINESISNSVGAMFSNPRNLVSVLTQNVGGYSAESFTYDKSEAAKDPNKILLKPSTDGSPGVMDESGTNYKAQRTKAEEWVTKSIKSQMDAKVGISPTAQAQLQERRPKTPSEYGAESDLETAKNLAQNLVYALTGDANQASSGTKYLSAATGIPFTKTKEGFTVVDDKGNTQIYKFKQDGTLADANKFVKSFIGPISRTMNISEDEVIQQFGRFLPKGAKLNESTEAKGFEPKPKRVSGLEALGKYIDKTVSQDPFELGDKNKIANALTQQISGTGFRAKSSNIPYNDKIYVVNADGKESPLYDINKNEPQDIMNALKKWMKANPSGANAFDQEANAKALIKKGVIPSGDGVLD